MVRGIAETKTDSNVSGTVHVVVTIAILVVGVVYISETKVVARV
jgi:hypothetical protein